MSKRKPLPLRSPNWSPLDTDCGQLYPHLRPGDPAPPGLIAAFRSGKMRAKRCRPEEDKDAGALVPLKFWNDRRILRGHDGLLVVDSKRMFNPDIRFYVWNPDFKEIFGDEVVTAPKNESPSAQTPKVPANRGRTMAPEWREIYGEIAVQLFVNKRERGKQLTDDIGNYCKANRMNVPNRRDLERAIAALAKRVP
jgi:hypothetical protein